MMIVVSTLFVVLLSSLHIFMIGAPRIHVPRTDPSIMIDGALSKGEWQHAARVDIPGTGRVYVQRSAEFVYIAVEYTRAPSGIVDLFVSPANGQIYDFHASAKLGERQLVGNQFPEWIWWNNDDWTANVSRVDSFEERTFLRLRFASSGYGGRGSHPRFGVCGLLSRLWEVIMRRSPKRFSLRTRARNLPTVGLSLA